MTALLERRIEILEEKLESIVALGIITQINGGSVRVDINGESTHDLPVLFPKTQDDKFQFMPDIGEQVVCLFLPFGLEQGFVIGSIYSDVDTPPVDGSDKAHIKFKDGAKLEYDRATHKLTIDLSAAQGDVDLKCKNINATITENADITAKNVNVNVQDKAEVKATTEVIVDSPSITMKNGGEGMGVVTTECVCNVLGINHADGSTITKAQKA
ncbi:MAG: phage baseplate assembly protein V [Desulfobacterales bacterium]|nr:phage baseplate assembly protein V [Desulfobacterales bacterium]